MDLRDVIDNLQNDNGLGDPKGVRVTPEASAAIIARARELGSDGAAGLFVTTRPSEIGFDVGVGFDTVGADPSRPLRKEFSAPVMISDADWARLKGYTIDIKDGRFVVFSDISVYMDETPNPDSRKFILNREIVTQGSATIHRVEPGTPVLARMLLEIPGVKSLFFIQNFVTVTRDPGADWDHLTQAVGQALHAYFTHGGAPITPEPVDKAKLTEVERRIHEVIDDAVRPAVQRDGCDIAFAGYDDGVVQLYMLGSCSGCPSSRATLKMGVEKLLQDQVPEVREVVAIE